jgi:penicillin-binding protein 2
VANGGKLLRPQLVLRAAAPDELISERYPTAQPEIRDDIHVSERSLETVRQAMLGDVEDPESAAFGAFHEHGRPLLKRLRVGGKTGTAQVEKNGKFDHYTVWFASYAVADNTPRYAVVVMVDHGLSGGTTCAPVAAKIYRALEEREQRSPAVRKDSLVKN